MDLTKAHKAGPAELLAMSQSQLDSRSEQFRLLYRNAFTGITVNVVNAFIVAAVLWNHASRPFLIAWTAAHVLVALLRMMVVRMYRRAPAAELGVQRWGVLFSLGAACAGGTWGAMGLFATIDLSLPHQVFVVFVIGGMTIGALAMSGAFIPAYLAFLLPAWLPLIAALLLQAEAMYVAMAVLLAVFSGALHMMGRNLNDSILGSIRLSLERRELIDRLRDEVRERRLAERALKQTHDELEVRVRERTAELQRVNAEQARFVAILEATTDVVATVTTQGQISYLNQAGRELLGLEPDEDIAALNIRDFHPDWAVELILNEGIPTAIGEGVWSGEVALLDRGGAEIPVSKVIIAHTSPAGDLQSFSAIMRDITPLKQVEEALRAAKEQAEAANASKSRFLAAASHDLRQPLQSLEMYLGVLSRPVKQDRTAQIIHQMRNSVSSMRELLDALLDISKLDSGKLQPEVTDFPVQELLDAVYMQVSDVAHEKGLDLRMVPSSRAVRSDRVLLRRIVENLVLNAIRYTESGRILLGCRRRGEHIRIEVWDTGIGIPNDALDRIFQEFTQLDNPARDRRRGLGLGLAIVQRLARALGHGLDVTSTPGKGSMFAVEVRASHGQQNQRSEETLVVDGHQGGGSILFIEDDPGVLKATQILLELDGFRVVTAMTGEEALAQLERGMVEPDVILSDYRLPQGEIGVDAVQRIRNTLGHDIPAIILTGDRSPEGLNEPKARALQVLYKPIDGDKLITLIGRLLRAKYVRNV